MFTLWLFRKYLHEKLIRKRLLKSLSGYGPLRAYIERDYTYTETHFNPTQKSMAVYERPKSRRYLACKGTTIKSVFKEHYVHNSFRMWIILHHESQDTATGELYQGCTYQKCQTFCFDGSTISTWWVWGEDVLCDRSKNFSTVCNIKEQWG